MRNNAKRGLELRKKYGRGGLSTQEAGKQGIGSGVARASDIVSGSLSLDYSSEVFISSILNCLEKNFSNISLLNSSS